MESVDNVVSEEPIKKKRGRPPKAKPAETVAAAMGASATEAPKKKRGRPPKVKTDAAPAASAEAPKKKRGRPPKNAAVTGSPAVAKASGNPKAMKEALKAFKQGIGQQIEQLISALK